MVRNQRVSAERNRVSDDAVVCPVYERGGDGAFLKSDLVGAYFGRGRHTEYGSLRQSGPL